MGRGAPSRVIGRLAAVARRAQTPTYRAAQVRRKQGAIQFIGFDRSKGLPPYTLRIRFDDDIERTIDFRPILAGELYGPLRDPVVFSQVQIDPEVHTLVWPNGADFDPATLHDWPYHREAFMARARQWKSAAERERERA